MALDNPPIDSDSPTPDQPDQTNNPDLKPRSKRRGRRPSAELGLGSDQDLADLAKAFIEMRRERFPDLVKKKLDDDPSDDVIERMVADLKLRHGNGIVTDEDRAIRESGVAIAACYLRYSDENSQSRSIIDQLRKIMKRASNDGVVPIWSLVYVDYARSAVYDYRYGFEGLLKRMQSKKWSFASLYFDEFSRGSRDEDDAWRIAGLSRRFKIQLIGASDGFSMDDDDWDMKVGLYNLFNRLEKKRKSRRVLRGMFGAAHENRVLGKPPFGYVGKKIRDVNGNEVTGNKDAPVHERVIDPEAAAWVRKIFELAVIHKWTPYKIAEHLNQNKVDDWDGWVPQGVINILVNPAYIGLFIWGRTTKDYNYETRKWETISRPWTHWAMYYDSDLALIPKSWHVAMRKKHGKGSTKKRTAAKTVQERTAVTLFSKAMKCGYCGGDIKLLHSSSKSKSMYCSNGPLSVRGCQLKASKSVRIIERSLLGYIHTNLLTEDAIRNLVERANAYLIEEAKKPKGTVTAEKAELRRLHERRDKLLDRIERSDDADLLDAYDGRLVKLQRQIADLRKIVNEKEAANAPVPPPLNLGQVQTYLADIQGLLNQEVPASAEAIAELTGPIKITQESIPGRKRGAKWIATFSPDLLRTLAMIGPDKDYPDCAALEFLYRAKWRLPSEVTVEIRRVPGYERMGQKYLELRDNGASVVTIAAAHGTTEVAVRQAIHFAETGKRPTFKSGRRTGELKDKTPKYIDIADDVSRLKDEKMTFPKIIEWLAELRGIDVSEATVRRAWNYANPDAVKQAVDERTAPVERARYRHLPAKTIDLVKAMLADGHHVKEIARAAGCSENTVYRVRRDL